MTPAARIKLLQAVITRIERISKSGYYALELNVATYELYQLLEDAREIEDEALPKQEALPL